MPLCTIEEKIPGSFLHRQPADIMHVQLQPSSGNLYREKHSHNAVGNPNRTKAEKPPCGGFS
jgi:hypothetical protein